MPPDQVSGPLHVTVSSPVNVPPVCCSVVVAIVGPVLLKASVPLLMTSGPTLVTVPVNVPVPPLALVPPVMA